MSANINSLNDEITKTIKASSLTPKNHHHKRWYDEECRALKRKIHKLIRQEVDYKDTRKDYKNLIKYNCISYEEKCLIESFNKNEIQWHQFRPIRPIR